MLEKDFGCERRIFGKICKIVVLILLILPIQESIVTTHAEYYSNSNIVLDVEVMGQFLAAGRVNNLSIAIINNGPASVFFIGVTLSIPPPLALIGKDDYWYFLQAIKPGRNITIETTVFAPEGSSGSTYSASLYLNYTESGDRETETRAISLTVYGFVDPWLSDVTFSPLPAVTNQSLAVSGTITNEGSGDAKALSISIVPEPPFVATQASSMFIGEVSSGASVAFSVTCIVGKANAGTYPLNVVINYKDDTNTWGSKVIELYVKVVEQAEEKQSPGGQTKPGPSLSVVDILIIGLVGLGAGVALTIILYRRRLLKVPEISKKGA